MGTMRKLARTVAANQSYKKSGTTDMFGYYFKKIWREKAGHPDGTRWNPTKKPKTRRRK